MRVRVVRVPGPTDRDAMAMQEPGSTSREARSRGQKTAARGKAMYVMLPRTLNGWGIMRWTRLALVLRLADVIEEDSLGMSVVVSNVSRCQLKRQDRKKISFQDERGRVDGNMSRERYYSSFCGNKRVHSLLNELLQVTTGTSWADADISRSTK